jgi:hypothetical protein
MNNEIILYTPDENAERVEVRIDAEKETVWLSQEQIVRLFQRDQSVISRHIRNVFKEGELEEKSNMQKMHIPNSDKPLTLYNLDVIISVGYRVKSKQGTQFRIWANRILKEYLLKGYSVNNRINRIEDKVDALSKKVDEIDFEIHTSLPPRQGIFFDGQVFDAYTFVANIVKQAKQSIIVIDNYIDESVLLMLSKRSKNVNATIYTQPGKQLDLDSKKHNQQYDKIEIKPLSKSHDRFIIIDEEGVYHFGASLKDLGKKWFAFSKMEMDAEIILQQLENNLTK